MAHRDFTDSKGIHWLVWSTTPSSSSVLATDMKQGWLTFESESERRRLLPVPRDWEEASPERMELYLRAAQTVTRTTPIRGIPQTREDGDSA
jgi:hypothetical protein